MGGARQSHRLGSSGTLWTQPHPSVSGRRDLESKKIILKHQGLMLFTLCFILNSDPPLSVFPFEMELTVLCLSHYYILKAHNCLIVLVHNWRALCFRIIIIFLPCVSPISDLEMLDVRLLS